VAASIFTQQPSDGAPPGADASAPGSGVAAVREASGSTATRNGGGAPAQTDAGLVLVSAPVPGGAGGGAHGGSGAVGLAERAYEFVAPGQIGPRSQGPTLGRSADFTDPIERPG
jgi:hypothetical protein